MLVKPSTGTPTAVGGQAGAVGGAVGMADRAGQRVGGVRPGDPVQLEQALHHVLYLFLIVRLAVTDRTAWPAVQVLKPPAGPQTTAPQITAPRDWPSSGVDGLAVQKISTATVRAVGIDDRARRGQGLEAAREARRHRRCSRWRHKRSWLPS